MGFFKKIGRASKKLFKAVGPVLRTGLPLALPFLGGPIGGIFGSLAQGLGRGAPQEPEPPPPPPAPVPRYTEREILQEEEEEPLEYVEEEEEQ